MLHALALFAMSLSPSATTAQIPTSPACAAAEFRQFDFWLGDWEVYGGPKLDTVVGHNRIARAASGCALVEHWVNSNGRDGRSLNVYEPARKQWSQFWIGSDGIVLRLSGGMNEGAMEMRGELANDKGGVQLQRIRWTPRADGSVEQRWDTSDDAGQSWQTSFVGIYRRKAPG